MSTHRHPEADGDGRSIVIAAEFEVVRSREAEGLSLYLRSVAGSWHFRVSPIRDPSQVRFWCLVLEPCMEPSVNAPQTGLDPFVASPGLTRDRMLALLAQVREEPMDWLRDPGNRALMAWLRDIAGTPVPGRPQPPRSSRLPASDPGGDVAVPSTLQKRSVIP
jgi:hypothetical protein